MKFRTIGLLLLTAALLAGCASQSQVSSQDPRVLYDEALRQLEAGKYQKAQTLLQRLVLSAPGLSYIDSVQYNFAMTFFGNEDYHLAVAEFRRLINSFPRSELLDDAALMIGKSYFEAAPNHVGLDQSDNDDAIRELKAFLEDYPASNRRSEGEQLLSRAIEKMVSKQYLAGRQYYRMGNRVSARLYLEDLVTEYPESPFAPEALLLLAKLDEKDNKLTDARDKLNNLLNAFPKAPAAAKATEMKAKLESKIAAQAAKDSTAAAQLNGEKGD